MATAEPTRTWDSSEAAEIWRQSAGRRAQFLGVATDRLLAAARIEPGMRVVDVAAGTGDSSLVAARKVGPDGSVLATDISQTMLDVATDLAREAGLSNLETLVADATRIDLTENEFDAAICRFGLMFMPDLQAALSRVRHALKPDARFSALVWSTDAHNPWMAIPLAIVREMNRMPSQPPSLARTTSLSAPGLLERAFRRADFEQVSVSPIATPRDYASLDEACQVSQSSSPAQGELTREMNDAERERYAAELKRRFSAYVQADGRCVIPGEALLVVGKKPADAG